MNKRLDILCLMAVCLISGLISLYLGESLTWDLANYHYYNGFALLNGRLGYDIAPAQIQSYLNPLPDVLCYLMVTYLKPQAVGFILGFIQGVNVFLVFKIVSLCYDMKGWRDILLGLAVSFAGYLGAGSFSEIGTFYWDNVTSLFALASLYLILAAATRSARGEREGLTLRVAQAFLLAGFAAGLKLTAVIYVISLVAVLVLVLPGRVLNLAVAACSAACGVVVSSGFWMKIMYQHFQSPLFPFFNAIFKSPFYQAVNFSDMRFFPRDPLQALFYPFYFLTTQSLVGDVPFRDPRLALCYAAFVLFLGGFAVNRWLLKGRYPWRLEGSRLAVVVYCLVAYLVWQLKFSIYRYLLPVEMLSGAFLLVLVAATGTTRRVVTGVVAALIVLCTVATVPFDWGRVPWHDRFFVVEIDGRMKLPSGSLVLMVDEEPLAYLVPFFPRETRFVRLNSFPDPSQNDLLQDQVKEAIASCRSEMYVVTDGVFEERDQILDHYGLKALNADYLVRSNLHDRLVVSPVVKAARRG